jgi:hypothetical protein
MKHLNHRIRLCSAKGKVRIAEIYLMKQFKFLTEHFNDV